MHYAAQKTHLAIECCTGITDDQMQAHTNFFDEGQLTVLPLRDKPVNFTAGGFEFHGHSLASMTGRQVAEPVQFQACPQA